MNNPKISIIVLTYNHEKYLRQCIDNILNQEVNVDYEVLIGNDKSPDNTEKILNEYAKKYPEKIKPINRVVNIGATNNFYDLICRAKGDFITSIETDDYWTDKTKLQKLYDFLLDNSDYVGVFHSVTEVDENGVELSKYPRKNLKKYVDEIKSIEEFLKLSIKDNLSQVFHIQSLFFRNVFKRSISRDLEKYMTSTKMICDLNTKLFVLSKGKIKFIDKDMGVYRRIRKKDGTSFSSQNQRFIFNETSVLWETINKFYEYKYNKVIIKIKKIIKINYFFNLRIINEKDDEISNSLSVVEKTHVLMKYILWKVKSILKGRFRR